MLKEELILQIYIPLWLDLLSSYAYLKKSAFEYLHSTMVRFIIRLEAVAGADLRTFTFHYG